MEPSAGWVKAVEIADSDSSLIVAGPSGASAGRRGSGSQSVSSGRSPEDVFRASYVRLVQSLALIVDDKEEAADAVQEAFLELERRWARVSGYEDPVGWVRRVALNRLLSVRRSMSRRANALDRMNPGVQEQSPPDAVNLALRQALKRLPARQRTAVVLFYFADLPVAEIAAAMGVSEGSVNQHLHRARESLRREWGVGA